MHRSSLLAAVLVAVLFALPTPSDGQTANAGEPRFASFDVLVTDDAGQRVTGLTRVDFSLRENGTPVEITNTASGQLPRRIVLYFDNASLSTIFRHEFIDAAKSFVQTLRPSDRVMIVTWNRAFTIPLAWTADRAAITTALDAIATETAAASQRSIEKAQLERQIVDMLRTDSSAAASSEAGGASLQMTFDSLVASARRFAENEQLVAKQSLASINTVLAALSGADGRKAIVIASEWLPTQPGADLFQQLDSVKAKIDSGSFSTTKMKQSSALSSPLTEMSRYSVAEELATTQKTAQASETSIYVLTAPAGERTASGIVGAPAAETDPGSATVVDALRTLATATGGVTWVGTKPADALISISADLDARHTIGYLSQAPEGTPVTIDVTTKNGQPVRAQKSVVIRSPAGLMADRVIANQTQPALTNNLGIAARHLNVTTEGEKRRIPVQVLVPLAGLRLEQNGAVWTGGFSVFTSSGNAAGEATAVSRQEQEVRLDEQQKTDLSAPGKGIVLQFDVIVEPSVDRISVGVLDHSLRNAGFYLLQIGK